MPRGDKSAILTSKNVKPSTSKRVTKAGSLKATKLSGALGQPNQRRNAWRQEKPVQDAAKTRTMLIPHRSGRSSTWRGFGKRPPPSVRNRPRKRRGRASGARPSIRNDNLLLELRRPLWAAVSDELFGSDKPSDKETREDRRCRSDAAPSPAWFVNSRSAHRKSIRMFECKCGERTWSEY